MPERPSPQSVSAFNGRDGLGWRGVELQPVFLLALRCHRFQIASSMNSFVPLSKLMAEQIAALKQWSVGRARPSTSTSEPPERKLRKLGGEVGKGESALS